MRSALSLGDRLAFTVGHDGRLYTVRARPYYQTRTYVIEEAPDCPALIGQSTMPRWSKSTEKNAHRSKQHLHYRAEDVTMLVFEDLYALHRALSYTLDRYETNEIPRLTTAIGYCQALHGVVLGLRKDNFQELIGRITSLADQVVEVIGLQVSNPEKDAALERVIVTRKGVDSLNRVNSSAACLQMLTAVGGLIRREISVTDISQIYAGRRQAIRLALVTLETQVLIVEDFLNQILDNWNIVRIRRRELTVAQLEQFVVTLDKILVKPFSTTFQHVVREFQQAIQHIRSGHLDIARSLLVTSAASMRLRRLRVQLEVVHYRVASANYDVRLRSQKGVIAATALNDLKPLVGELRSVHTLDMVDFSITTILFSLSEAMIALERGDCATAADNLRLALRDI